MDSIDSSTAVASTASVTDCSGSAAEGSGVIGAVVAETVAEALAGLRERMMSLNAHYLLVNELNFQWGEWL